MYNLKGMLCKVQTIQNSVQAEHLNISPGQYIELYSFLKINFHSVIHSPRTLLSLTTKYILKILKLKTFHIKPYAMAAEQT